MTDHDHAVRTEAFFSLHHGLPRQSPGSDATVRRLLEFAGPLPHRPRVLDLGCGPGRATLLLAAEAGADVTAVDLHQPFLDELRAEADARGLGDRVRTVRADMAELSGPDFPDGSFDLVWAEGSAYLIGFDTALRDWKRLLAPGGSLVVTECAWTTDAPTAEARAFWEQETSMRPVAANTEAAVAAGYHALGVLVQPDSDWDAYYVPLAERVAGADASAPAWRGRSRRPARSWPCGAATARSTATPGTCCAPRIPAGWSGRRPRRTRRPCTRSTPPRSRRRTRPFSSTRCAPILRPGCPVSPGSRPTARTGRWRRTPC